MNPYTKPNEPKTGANRPRIQHLAQTSAEGRTRREREAEKEGVAAVRRAIKKSARQHLRRQMQDEFEEN